MKVNPDNGYIEINDAVIMPNMTVAQIEALGFKVERQYNQIYTNIKQQSFPNINIRFTHDEMIETIVMYYDLTSSITQAILLEKLGIEINIYAWGEVIGGIIPQQGEGWLEIRYKR